MIDISWNELTHSKNYSSWMSDCSKTITSNQFTWLLLAAAQEFKKNTTIKWKRVSEWRRRKKVIEDRNGWTRKGKKRFHGEEWERERATYIYKIKTIIGKRKKNKEKERARDGTWRYKKENEIKRVH